MGFKGFIVCIFVWSVWYTCRGQRWLGTVTSLLLSKGWGTALWISLPFCRFWESNSGLQVCAASACIYPQSYHGRCYFLGLTMLPKTLGLRDLLVPAPQQLTCAPCPAHGCLLLLLLLQYLAMQKRTWPQDFYSSFPLTAHLSGWHWLCYLSQC